MLQNKNINKHTYAAVLPLAILLVGLSFSACSGQNSDDNTNNSSSDYNRTQSNNKPYTRYGQTSNGSTYTQPGRTIGATIPGNPRYDRPGATMPIGTTNNQ